MAVVQCTVQSRPRATQRITPVAVATGGNIPEERKKSGTEILDLEEMEKMQHERVTSSWKVVENLEKLGVS